MKKGWMTAEEVFRDGGREMYCPRCGATLRLTLPMVVEEWASHAKAFEKEHRACQPKKK